MASIEMIRAAAERIGGHVRRTPLLSSPFLNVIAGRLVLVKAECLQHTGSFKYRGARSAISALDPKLRAKGVIAYSSGNHAQGIARAAAEFGIPAVIVMPADAPELKIAYTRALGAEVVLYDRAGGESREALGEAIRDERGLALIRPYDEPLVIAGQGTCGLELAEQAREQSVESGDVLVCCGGGGLSAGIALALEAEAPGLRVRPCEPEGFDDAARSLAAGRILSNPKETGSICDAILTPAPGRITFPVMQRLCGPGLAVSDDECLQAMALAMAHLKIAVEPGGAVALAAALFRGGGIDGDAVICIASGGNADPETLARALAAGTPQR